MATGRGGVDSSPPKVGTTVIQPQMPGGGGWVAVGKVGNGTNIKWKYVGKQKPAPAPADTGGGGGGGGSGSGGSGGGGSGADEGLSPYIQAYRLNFFANGKPSSSMLAKAKDGNWSVSYFLQRVRLEDKNYWKSEEARGLLPKFNQTMKVLFPGLSDKARQAQLMKSPFYKKAALWYLKNGVGLKRNGQELLYTRITNTKQWKNQNPYWKQYVRNANPAVAAEANPLLYKAHLDTLKTAFGEYGMELPEDYYRSFFKSRYASNDTIGEMQENLKGFAQAKGSFSWFTGRDPSNAETKQTIFGGDQQPDLKNRLAKAFSINQSFKGTDEKRFGSELSEQGKLTQNI